MSGPRIESLMTWCALALAAVTVTGAVAESPFAHLKATYEQELAALDRAYEAAVSNAPGHYVQGLQAAEKKCIDGGDLDGVLIVRNERVRFEVEKALSETNLVTKPSDLAAAQTRFMDAPKRANMGRMRGIGTDRKSVV